MARYFFHVRDSTEIIDEEGTELAGPDQARIQAIAASGEMLKDLGGTFWNHGEWKSGSRTKPAKVCALTFSADQQHLQEPLPRCS